ncbi:stAR-related lipid transfer protein 7, mitochondrial [Ambystoma mexicanum]|uniref:stAR-related lipid transfer protein 7, mitochondrial n=1 Tax=Ambystoma mexicanum TaxID=8296 RepID=UPI0037E88099
MWHSLHRTPPAGFYSYYLNPVRFASRGVARPEPADVRLPETPVFLWVLSWFQKRSSQGPKQKKSLVSLLASHCSYVTGQRVWRAQQIGQLYNNLYSEQSRKSLFSCLWRRFRGRQGGACKLIAALTGVFMWEEERVKKEELQRSAAEMLYLSGSVGNSNWEGSDLQTLNPQPAPDEVAWEIVISKKQFKLWRRPIGGSSLYQYRVFGTYRDVTPRQFFNVQLDTEYRKKWDALVIKLEVLERDAVTGSEVLHWVTHFPYPMYSRDYVYVRRYHVDRENNLMILVSRAVEHPDVPELPSFVRVRTYESQMVIRPHTTFDENGFDYLLTYSDNPQTVFPRYCVSWMVSSGMPDFLDKLHMAAVRATNMEIKVKDYISVPRPMEASISNTEVKQSSDHNDDNNHSSGQMGYA